MITGECLSKKPILIKDIATSTLHISEEEGTGEEGTHCCSIKASKAHGWLCVSPRAHAIHCAWHKGRMKSRAGRLPEWRKGSFRGLLAELHMCTYFSLGRRGQLTAISNRMVAVTQQDMDG